MNQPLLDKTFCESQIARLGGTRFWTSLGPEVIRDLVTALQTAPDEATAETFVTNWIDTHHNYPQRVDILQGIRALEPMPLSVPRPEPQRPTPCERCAGPVPGWIGVEVIRTDLVGLGQKVTELRPCSCAFGRLIAKAIAGPKAKSPSQADRLAESARISLGMDRLANVRPTKDTIVH